jgi:molybdopterin-guanine dinucleotide biosynthesis adapter protein
LRAADKRIRSQVSSVKAFGIAGFSGSGKTTMIERLIPRLLELGVKVAVIKHAHHAFDVDTPGKDSYRARAAGASEVLVASSVRWALMHELRSGPEPELPELLGRLSPCDLVLVEGFKRQPMPKLEVHRAAFASPWLYPQDPDVIAIASDVPVTAGLPQFALEAYDAIAEFITQHTGCAYTG